MCASTFHAKLGPPGMITVYGEGRGFRVVWLLEEMGLAYRLRPVDLLAGVENDRAFLAINPASFIPAITDGIVTMVESVAIMQYLMARYGPTPLSPAPGDPDFPAYLQFLHLGEAGLASPMYFHVNARRLRDPSDRENPTARHARAQFENRLTLVQRQLEHAPYLAGERFTAADICVTYALVLARVAGGITFEGVIQSYLDRMRARDGYHRALDACPAMNAAW